MSRPAAVLDGLLCGVLDLLVLDGLLCGVRGLLLPRGLRFGLGALGSAVAAPGNGTVLTPLPDPEPHVLDTTLEPPSTTAPTAGASFSSSPASPSLVATPPWSSCLSSSVTALTTFLASSDGDLGGSLPSLLPSSSS